MIQRAQSGGAEPAARPFLKWAGGKKQLIPQFEPHFPAELAAGKLTTYVEPFVGAGAVFFHVVQNYRIRRAYLFDVNEELCLIYTVVKRAVEPLIEELCSLRERYLALEQQERERLYYSIRERLNAARDRVDHQRTREATSRTWIERAAQLLFLNRTCYNGLFRTNSRGAFNSPFGRYKKPSIVDPDNLRRASRLLRKATIRRGDFEDCASRVDSETFVYFDPPYRPLSSTSSFTSYSRGSFSDAEQERLGRFYARLDRERHPKLMLSNSDPTNVDRSDRFFHELYRGYRIAHVSASRMINSKASGRGAVRELLIMNY
jgi:DNA adenine methylase